MYFDHSYPSPNSSQIQSLPYPPNFVSSSHPKPIKSNLCYPYDVGVAWYWSMINPPCARIKGATMPTLLIILKDQLFISLILSIAFLFKISLVSVLYYNLFSSSI